MSKRLIKKYKLLKFYQEDLWGKLAVRLSFKKVKINRLFHDIFQEKNAFRKDLLKERDRLKKKFLVDEPFSSDLQRRKRNSLFRSAFQELVKNLRKIYFRASFNFRTDKGKPKRKTRRLSNFARRLKNRHKLRRFSTESMNVRQFRNYVRKARKTNAVFLQFFRSLETRIDTLVFRLNLAKTAGEARQLVNHRNFLINGQSVAFSSESINMFDVFSVKDKSFFYKKSLDLFKKNLILFSVPSYLEVNFRIMSAVIFMWPTSSKVPYTRKIDARSLVSGGPKDGR
jgi:small subunit ribosomal protein S4